MKIFLDMDGVITDFVGGVCDLFGYNDAWPYGEYDICKVIGQSIWPKLKGEDFWINLKKTDEADEVMQVVSNYDFYICTSPTLDPRSASGKLIWLENNYPGVLQQRRFFITPNKHLLAGDHNILIDDSDDQITKWHAAGGFGLLFPRPWNKFHGEPDPMRVIRKLVEVLVP